MSSVCLAAMNLEMPGPGEVSHLRMVLLIVLGIIIITIPAVMVIIVAKLKARPPVRPGGTAQGTKELEETKGLQDQKEGSLGILPGGGGSPSSPGSGGNHASGAETGPPNA